MPKDTAKLKKHIALLCERLNKGAKLDFSGQSDLSYKGETKKQLETLDESIEENEDTTGIFFTSSLLYTFMFMYLYILFCYIFTSFPVGI